MKTSKEQLLNDVLADEDYGTLRHRLYFQGLAELRRRRCERQRRQLQACAACGLIAIGLLFMFASSATVRRAAPVPLRADQIVDVTGSGAEIIKTRLMDLTPAGGQFAYELIRTASAPGELEYISDGQLFELFDGQQMALVPAAEGGKRLCFLDSNARALFLEENGPGPSGL